LSIEAFREAIRAQLRGQNDGFDPLFVLHAAGDIGAISVQYIVELNEMPYILWISEGDHWSRIAHLSVNLMPLPLKPVLAYFPWER
jgi:hypothetical protein